MLYQPFTVLRTFREIGSHSFHQDLHSHVEVSSGAVASLGGRLGEIRDTAAGRLFYIQR